jgi:hypothetical protein
MTEPWRSGASPKTNDALLRNPHGAPDVGAHPDRRFYVRRVPLECGAQEVVEALLLPQLRVVQRSCQSHSRMARSASRRFPQCKWVYFQFRYHAG